MSKRSIWTRRILGFIIGLMATVVLLFSALVIWVNTSHFQTLATRLLETNLEDQLGEQVTVNAVNLHFFSMAASVEGLHVWNAVTDETILTAERVRVPLSLFPMEIGRLSIQNPTLSLHAGPNGKLREFRNIKTREGPPKPLKKLPWNSLEILNGTVRFESPTVRASLTQLQVQPTKGPIASVSGVIDVAARQFTDQAVFQWDETVIGPNRIAIPNLALLFKAVQITGQGQYTLDNDFSAEMSVVSELKEWNDLLTAPRKLDGRVTLEVNASGTPADPKAEVAVNAQNFEFQAPSKNTPIVIYRLKEVTSQVVATKQQIEVKPTPISVGTSHAMVSAILEPKRGPAPDYKTNFHLKQAFVEADGLSLKETVRAAGMAPTPWVDMSTKANIELSGPLKPLALKGNFILEGENFTVGDRPIEDPEVTHTLRLAPSKAHGQLSIDKNHVVVNVEEIRSGRTKGSGVVDIGFKPYGPLDISVDMPRANLADFGPLGGARLKGKGNLKGRIWGKFKKIQMLGHGSFRDFSSTGIDYADELTATIRSPDMKSVILDRAKAVKGETHYGGNIGLFFKPTFSLDTNLLISSGRIQDLTGMFMDLDGLKGVIDGGEIHLSGPFKDLDGDADLRTSDVSIFGEVFQTGRAQGQMNKGIFTLTDMRFTRDNGREGLSLHGSVGREWALNMNLNADLRLSTLTLLSNQALPLRGRLTGNLRLDNTLFSPEVHGRVLLSESYYGPRATDDSKLRLNTTDGLTAITGSILGKHVNVEAKTSLFDTQAYNASFDLNEFPLHLIYPEGADGGKIKATLTGDVNVDGIIGGSTSDIGVTSRFDELRFNWGKHILRNERPFTYVQNKGGWRINDMTLKSQESDATTIQVRASRTGEQTTAEGKGTMDLDLMRAVVPGLTRVEGKGLLHFSSKRTGGKTHTIARMIIDAPLIRHNGFPGTLEDVQASISGTDSAYTIERFSAGLGGGKLTGTAIQNEKLSTLLSPTANPTALGVIEAENWVPTRFTLQGKAENTQVRWTDALAPAVGNATISFDGPADQLLLSGQVEIQEMNFTERINWEDWVVEIGDDLLVEAPPTNEKGLFAINIGITADKTIRLLNNVADATASAELQVIGDTSRPGMTGWVRVDEGLVYLQDREFKIDRGDMKFRDPWSWDPDLDFDMVTDLDSRRRRYRINYRVLGPYSNWTTQTTADPWLSQADVNALLWFGVTAEELEEIGELGTAVGQAAVDLFIQDFILADYLGLLGFQESVAGQLLPQVDLVTGANTRGEYSSDPRIKLTVRGLPPHLKASVEFNLLRADHYGHIKWAVTPSLSLSGWYANRRREGLSLPADIGALGTDLLWLHEFD